MSSNSSTDCSKLILPDLNLIASQTKLVIRKSARFTPDAFLQSLLESVVSGLASINQIAGSLKERVPRAMARQSLHERFSPQSTAFLMSVHGNLIEQCFEPTRIALKRTALNRIIIEDASGQVMPKSNAANFPAHGNHHGSTAGVKIDLAYDLLTGSTISHTLEQATTQDKTIGKNLLVEVQKGDLVLRDMGYFSLVEFTAIERLGAKWLTRLPLTTGVMLENKESLEKHLKRCEKSQELLIDTKVIVGAGQKRCRLVAIRATPQVTAQRRRERRKKAKENGKPVCAKGLVRDGWHLMLTNLKSTEAAVKELAEVYRARWAVEIQFRAWKQSLNLSKALNRKTNTHHIEAIVLTAMIAHQLGMRIATLLEKQIGRARLSLEKLYDVLAGYILKTKSFREMVKFEPDSRHISRDKRTRKSPIESGITALT